MDGKEECVIRGFILSDYPGHLKLYRRYDGYTDMGEYIRIPGDAFPDRDVDLLAGAMDVEIIIRPIKKK